MTTPHTPPRAEVAPEDGRFALYSRAADGIGFSEALTHARMTGGIALLSTPAAFLVAAECGGERWITVDGEPAFDEVFEARVFTAQAELRWYDNSPGRPRAVLLTEDAALLPSGPFDQDVPALRATETLESRYLLWGDPVSTDTSPREWSSWYSPRIGTVHLPGLPIGPELPAKQQAVGDERMHLIGREYICCEPRHGNAHVAEERLLRLEIARPELLKGEDR